MKGIDNGADYEIFKHNIENSPKRSEFNLSYKNIFNCPFGMLRPCYIEETLPSDKFTISNSIMVRVAPMEVPLMSRIRVFVDYYYMKNEWIWNNWREFVTKGRSGNYEVTKPVWTTDSTDVIGIEEYTKQNQESKIFNGALSKESLAAMLEFPILNKNVENDEPEAKRNYNINVDMMPFFMYQKIYRDYYMNKNLNQDDKVWFPEIEDNFILGGGQETNYKTRLPDTPAEELWIEDHTNKVMPNAHSLLAIRWSNWRDDYFTSAMPWPQRGTAPYINAEIGEAEAETAVTTTINTTNNRQGTVIFNNGRQALTGISGQAAQIGAIQGASGNWTPQENQDLRVNDITATSTATTTLDGASVEIKITAENLRRLLAVQVWQERNARTDGDYNQMIRAHYGWNPGSEERRPIYIGGTVQEVVVTEVLQTSETNQTPQGNAAGHGISAADGFVGTFTAPDFGFIMGIMRIVPEPMYCEGLPKRYSRETALDYYWPEFDGLGAQEILTKELYVGETEDNEKLWAWQERASEYKHRRNIVTGELADSDDTYYNAWTIKRDFTQAPEFNQEFVTTEKNISMNAFTIESETPFTVEMANIVKANRPIPYLSAPNNMGVD